MIREIEYRITGVAFVVAALLLWFGWALSTHHIGEYIVATDFQAVGDSMWYWIWMYRIHIFGWVITGVALFSLISILNKKPYSVLVLPGAGVLIIGTFILAIANAFYYNFGAWGVGQTAGMSPAEIEQFVHEISYTNHYVTCFVRFGRVFSGVGLVLLGAAFIAWNLVSKWLGWFTVLLGLAAIAIIMGIPDSYQIYKPVFHIKVIWLLIMGFMILFRGMNTGKGVS